MKVQIVAPDSFSGDAFNKVIKDGGFETIYNVYSIPPRVIEDKISTSPDIVNKLNEIFSGLNTSHKIVVIACNTLQLWIDKIDPKYRDIFKIITTFESSWDKFRNYPVKPLWLGTTPLVRNTSKFPTLLTYNKPLIQDLVQELIWRVKMYGNNDISTAQENVKKDINLSKAEQKIIINKTKEKIIKSLAELGVKDVILGCTELPIVFNNKTESGIKFYDPAEVLSEYINNNLKTLLN